VTACDSVISFAGRMFNSQQNRLSKEKTALYVAMRANGDVTGTLGENFRSSFR
jgi:hypothetical protein